MKKCLSLARRGLSPTLPRQVGRTILSPPVRRIPWIYIGALGITRPTIFNLSLFLLMMLLVFCRAALAATNIYLGGSADEYDRNYSGSAMGCPYANNAGGATGITAVTAWLNGFLISTGSAETTVYVYWGNEDGVTNKTSWDHWADFGVCTQRQSLTTNVTLTQNTTYYYRFYASNAAGEDAWAFPPSGFVTYPAAAVNNASGATNVLDTSACLNGTLTSTGWVPTTVHVYWGTEDGTNNKASWSHTNDFGVQALGPLTTNVTGLSSGTLYYYRFYATNVDGEVWANSSKSFTTLIQPAVNNGWGAGPVSFTTATLSGNLTSGTLANVYIYWGGNTNNWANTNSLGNRANGVFWSGISGLSEGSVYYYRCYATNYCGGAWAADIVTFTTLVSFTAWNGGSADGYDKDLALSSVMAPAVKGTVFSIK